jgi:hypothetical protein
LITVEALLDTAAAHLDAVIAERTRASLSRG